MGIDFAVIMVTSLKFTAASPGLKDYIANKWLPANLCVCMCMCVCANGKMFIYIMYGHDKNGACLLQDGITK